MSCGCGPFLPCAGKIYDEKWEYCTKCGNRRMRDHDDYGNLVPCDSGQKVIMPKELTAENGAKAAFMGEFKINIDFDCPNCSYDEFDEDCEFCGGQVAIVHKETISWTQIKEMYKKIVEVMEVLE